MAALAAHAIAADAADAADPCVGGADADAAGNGLEVDFGDNTQSLL